MLVEISEHDPSLAVNQAEVVEGKGDHSDRHLVAAEDSGYVPSHDYAPGSIPTESWNFF